MNISIAVVEMKDTFGWSMTTQAMVMSSFFWGYICSQVIGALLAQSYGKIHTHSGTLRAISQAICAVAL